MSMSQAKILIQMHTAEEQNNSLLLSQKQKEIRGRILLTQGLILLNNAILLEHYPHLAQAIFYLDITNSFASQIDSAIHQSNSKLTPEALVQQATGLLKSAVRYGNDEADELLKTLSHANIDSLKTEKVITTQATNILSQKKTYPFAPNRDEKQTMDISGELALKEDAEETTQLNEKISIIDDYIQRPRVR
jgi:hypothetical protein